MKLLGRVLIFAALATAFLFVQESSAWEIHGRWYCCGKQPKERVKVRCNDGRVPTYVKVGNRWCKKNKGRQDDAGPCYETLDQAARAWCKE